MKPDPQPATPEPRQLAPVKVSRASAERAGSGVNASTSYAFNITGDYPNLPQVASALLGQALRALRVRIIVGYVLRPAACEVSASRPLVRLRPVVLGCFLAHRPAQAGSKNPASLRRPLLSVAAGAQTLSQKVAKPRRSISCASWPAAA